MKYFIRFILLFEIIPVFSQNHRCGTIATSEQLDFLKELQWKSRLVSAANFSLIRIPVTIHIIRKSDGTGGLAQSSAEFALSSANDLYTNSGVEFFTPQSISFIDDDDFYDLSSSQESDLGFANDVAGTINIYFSNTLKSGTALCGYTYFPPSADRIFVANGCISGGTFEHELGHYFTLFHTHGTSNNGTTNELVNGSNCTSAGDFICDTPADPNLAGNVNSTCQYTGNIFDANNDFFSPMVNNLMSYAPGMCRDTFTEGQFQRIRNGFENGRAYLNIETAEFESRFTSDLREACEGALISFSHNTALATAFKWTFEGGTPTTSTQANPKITYENEGVFSVTLEVSAGTELNDVLLENSFISIENPLNNAIDVNFNSQIDNTMELSTNFEIINSDLGITFLYSNLDAESNSQSGSVFIDNFNYVTETYPNTDLLVSPKFEMAGIRGFAIGYDLAYAQRVEGESDSLFIVYRVDCEKEWSVFQKIGGSQLSSVVTLRSEFFEPSSSEWMSFNTYFPLTDITYLTLEIGLMMKSYNGNNLYLDNISIEPDFLVDAPSNFRVSSIDSENFIFRWIDNSSNELGFIIEVSSDGSSYETYDSLLSGESLYSTNYSQLLADFEWIRLYAIGKGENLSERTGPINLNEVLGSNELAKFRFYPNPFSDKISLKDLGSGTKTVRIYSLDGRIVFEITNAFEKQFAIDTKTLPNGSYILEVRQFDERELIKKIIYKK